VNPRRIMSLIAASLLSACSGASNDTLPAHRVAFPGFSAEVPDGKVTEESGGPSAGRRKIQLDSAPVFDWFKNGARKNGTLVISWTNDSVDHEQWSTELLPAMATAIGQADAKVLVDRQLDERRWIAAVGKPTLPMAVGIVRCDPRFTVQFVFGYYLDLDTQLHALQTIMDSVKCEVTAANLAGTTFATRLPATFGRVEAMDMQIYRSVDGENLVVNDTQGNLLRAPALLRPVVDALVGAALGAKPGETTTNIVTDAHRAGSEPATLMRLTSRASNTSVYVGALWCERAGVTGMMIWFAPEMTDARAAERFSQIDCPGAPSTESPPFEPLLAAACKDGNATACEIEKEPR
jgi:hypothetical protein